ncbi:MAG TPA: ABC transporter ATP-binding protein [Candidatus Diapherotrites archaeon]|nr:ABC transporter ATP-binding protein [Candidatus Diapherotrites archaeon]
MLKIKNLNKNYGAIKAADNCSFTIKPNKITGLIGPNGAGKSTIFNIVSGFETEDSGTIILNKIDISKFPPYKIANSGISRVFQKSKLFENLSVYDNLAIAIQEDNTSFFKSLFKTSKLTEEQEKRITEILKLLRIYDIKDKQCRELSYGQKRLTELARAIVKKHKLLMLDEPVAGVHPSVRNTIMDILKLLKGNGETILLIEHDMFFTLKVCDEIIVMDDGKVIAQGTPSQIKNNKKVLEAYLGD